VRRYPAAKYALTGNWTDGLDDLIQDVVADALLADRQADYILEHSTDLDHLRHLLDRQTRYVLIRHRTRTVIDNVLARARPILNSDPFVKETRSGRTAYRLASEAVELRAANLPELAAAAAAIRDIPTVPPPATGERASQVYRTADLHELLQLVATTLPTVFTIRELDRILEHVLTRFLPSVLDLDAGFDDEGSPGPKALRSLARTIADQLSTSEAITIALKIADQPDRVVAETLGVSRPTAAKHKGRANDVIRTVLVDVDPALRILVVDELGAMVRSVVAEQRPAALPLTLVPLQ
jgi:hypothetical protein